MTTPPFVHARLAAIEGAGLMRRPPTIETQDGVHGRIEGRDVLLFCSNDYLGLRTAPEVVAAAAGAAEAFGAGSGSSRLIAGSLAIHQRLEEALASWLGTEAALVFSSGYQANLAVLQGLAGSEDLLLSDRLNHASLIDGCRLARARFRVFPHGESERIQDLASKSNGQVFVVGEGLYSMDGDRGPVAAWLSALAASEASERSHVLVDEAHALGVLGPSGAGVCAEAGCAQEVLLRVGTFGKALGSHGAFVACSAALRELLVNTGRTYIFTTALPPTSAGAALASIGLVQSDRGEELRARLRARLRALRDGLSELGLAPISEPDSPVLPVVVGSVARAMAIYEGLRDRGIYAMAIRPPTVPPETCRIRFTVSAAHTPSHVEALLSALAGTMDAGGLPRS